MKFPLSLVLSKVETTTWFFKDLEKIASINRDLTLENQNRRIGEKLWFEQKNEEKSLSELDYQLIISLQKDNL